MTACETSQLEKQYLFYQESHIVTAPPGLTPRGTLLNRNSHDRNHGSPCVFFPPAQASCTQTHACSVLPRVRHAGYVPGGCCPPANLSMRWKGAQQLLLCLSLLAWSKPHVIYYGLSAGIEPADWTGPRQDGERENEIAALPLCSSRFH